MKLTLFLPFSLSMTALIAGCIPEGDIVKTETPTQTDTIVDVPAVNQAPSAFFISNLQSTTLHFDAGGSFDSDGVIVSYKWYLNNQLVSELDSGSVEVLYNGLNFLKLEVIDDSGARAYSKAEIFDVTDVDSDNLPPMISQIVYSSGPIANFEANLTVDVEEMPNELNYKWIVDGSEVSDSSSDSLSLDEGEHSYELVVTDSDGLASSTGQLNFTINNANNAPTGEIVVANQQYNYIKIDAYDVVDLDGDELTYHWYFGDGNESKLTSAAHQYEKAGIYVVTLKLSDGIDTTTITKTIRVLADMPFVPVVDNIIENGGFENGLNHWDSRGAPDIELSDVSNSGNSSVLVTNREHYWEGVRYTFSETLTQGNDYQFYAWVKLAEGEEEKEEAILTIHYKDANGVNYNSMATTQMTQDGWSLLHSTFKYYAQGEVTDMWIYVESSNPTASFYVDDFALTGVIDPVMPLPTSVDISVDTNEYYQFIDGFGAAIPMWDLSPWTDQQTKKMVGVGEDELGLSILRTNISSDPNQWGNYASMLALADEYSDDLKIMGTPWSPPAYMKDNNSTTGNENGAGHLLVDYYSEYAQHLNDFVVFMKQNDVKMDVISVQNEPDFYATYESCEWTSDELFNFVANNADKIKNTQVMVGESLRFNRDYTDKILEDTQALNNMEIVGGHLYAAELAGFFEPYPLAEEKGKQVWMTEWLTHNADSVNGVTDIWGDQDNIDVWNETLDQAMGSVHKSMIINWNAYVWWWAKRYYSFMGDGVAQYGTQNGEILKRGWAFSHYSKFVRPGALRVKTTLLNTQIGLDVTAYQKDGQIILVILNRNETNKESVSIGVNPQINSAEYFNTSQTNARKKLEVVVTGQSVELDIPARSISTVVLNY